MPRCGEKITGYEMKESMKKGKYYGFTSGNRLFASDIEDQSIYEYTGEISYNGVLAGEFFKVKLIEEPK